MTPDEKLKTAHFLDLAADFLGSGYKSQAKDYQFDENNVPQTPEKTADDTLEQIAAEIKVCRACALCEKRTNAAPGEGAQKPLVMVIGEGPGADEDAAGRPFVGRAGQLLDKMLASIGLSRNKNCFIANVVKCRPPGNRDPLPEETAACAPFLERQIKLLQPKFILCAGRIAARSLLKTEETLGKLRGKFLDLEAAGAAIPMLVTYHPSALLRNEEYKRPAWEDLKLLRARLEEAGLISGASKGEG
ncbi:MAG: uracil-DNA glycosylase [Treponema sp.]|nr:uracil-DNA glycosylase [Treponema sp.]